MPTIEIDGAQIAYTDTGMPPGHPQAQTVFFGHGLLFGGWMFRDQIAALRSRYRCVAIDWRGQGDSPASRHGCGMDALAGDAAALITALGLDPVHYVGISMGGYVGLRLAARPCELVRSLILLDTGADAEAASDARRYRLLALVYRALGLRPVQAQVSRLMFGPDILADPSRAPLIEEWATRLRRSGRAGVRRALLGVAERASMAEEIGAITMPTLIGVGEHDRATPPENSRRMAARIPGSRLVIIENSGHSSPLEQPAAVTALIEEFLGVDGTVW